MKKAALIAGLAAATLLGAKGFVQLDGSVADWYDDVSYVRVAA